MINPYLEINQDYIDMMKFQTILEMKNVRELNVEIQEQNSSIIIDNNNRIIVEMIKMDLKSRPLYVPILKSNQITSHAPDYFIQIHKIIILNNKVKILNPKRFYPHILNNQDSFQFKITLFTDRLKHIHTFILIPLKIRHKNNTSLSFEYII